MDWKTFRALETFSILYDIQIDEERYNTGPCAILGEDGEPISESSLFSCVEGVNEAAPWCRREYVTCSDGRIPELSLRLGVDGATLASAIRGWTPTLASSDHLVADFTGPIGLLWSKLLVAKLIRGALMRSAETSAYDALDALGLALIREMPPLPVEVIDSATASQWGPLKAGDWTAEASCTLALQSALMRVLYLLEASACYRGYHSIAHADDCLALVQALLRSLGVQGGRGECPYELVAQFDKAQGEFHARQHEKALQGFAEIARDLNLLESRAVSDGCRYFDMLVPESSAWTAMVRWPGQESLFWAYLGYPSGLQTAEALINLQRSCDAEAVVNLLRPAQQPNALATAYQDARREVIFERIRNDTQDHAVLPISWDGVPAEGRNLGLQRLAVETERQKNPTKRLADLRKRASLTAADRTEFDQTILEWAKGLGLRSDIQQRVAYASAELPQEARWTGVGLFREAALDLAVDRGWREHKSEVRSLLSRQIPALLRDAESQSDDTDWQALRTYTSDLFERLLDLGEQDRKSVTDLEIRRWREDHALVQPDTQGLPLEGPEKQLDLRRFLHTHFVLAAGVGDPPECEQCEECCCLVPQAVPDCATCRQLLSDNSAWQLDELGERQLHYYDRVERRNFQEIYRRLTSSTPLRTKSGWALAVLQRWNSYTPAMAASEGGGYFLYCTRESDDQQPPADGSPVEIGVVVDPGYGFVRNFLGQHYGIRDVTHIAVTHNHPDHLADFEALLNLVFALRKKHHGDQKIQALTSRGAFALLRPMIENSRSIFKDTAVLDYRPDTIARAEIGATSARGTLTLRATEALHKDTSETDSIGLLAEISLDAGASVYVGLPSDTKWTERVAQQYVECSVVCLHLGSMTSDSLVVADYFDSMTTSNEILRDGNHLHLPGVLWFLNEMKTHPTGKTRLVVLSEFGEEMSRGLRPYLASRLDDAMRNADGCADAIRVIPGDVGLLIDPVAGTMQCSCCEEFYPWITRFSYEAFGDSEQLFYVCPHCEESLSSEQKASVFRRKQTPLMKMIAQ